jgi:hypothetical protein
VVAAAIIALVIEKAYERWVGPRVRLWAVRRGDRRLAKDEALTAQMDLAAVDSGFAVALFSRMLARMIAHTAAALIGWVGILGVFLMARGAPDETAPLLVLCLLAFFFILGTTSVLMLAQGFSGMGAVARGVIRLRTDAHKSGENGIVGPERVRASAPGV